MLEFSIVSYTFLLFSYVYIECKWADLLPSPYFPTCRSVVAFPLLNSVLISPLAVPLVLFHSRALSDASFNRLWALARVVLEPLASTHFLHASP